MGIGESFLLNLCLCYFILLVEFTKIWLLPVTVGSAYLSSEIFFFNLEFKITNL